MDLLIEHGKNTPKVIGNVSDGTLKIEGSSFPENVRKFYDPINEWIELSKLNALTIECKFYYMASSSIIALLKTLKHAENVFGKDNISIIWKYEEDDDDILKIGEDFSHLLPINFKFIEEPEEAN